MLTQISCAPFPSLWQYKHWPVLSGQSPNICCVFMTSYFNSVDLILEDTKAKFETVVNCLTLKIPYCVCTHAPTHKRDGTIQHAGFRNLETLNSVFITFSYWLLRRVLKKYSYSSHSSSLPQINISIHHSNQLRRSCLTKHSIEEHLNNLQLVRVSRAGSHRWHGGSRLSVDLLPACL